MRTQLAAALSTQALSDEFSPATLLALYAFSAARLWCLEDLLQVRREGDAEINGIPHPHAVTLIASLFFPNMLAASASVVSRSFCESPSGATFRRTRPGRGSCLFESYERGKTTSLLSRYVEMPLILLCPKFLRRSPLLVVVRRLTAFVCCPPIRKWPQGIC
jgi:hypothetical protein